MKHRRTLRLVLAATLCTAATTLQVALAEPGGACGLLAPEQVSAALGAPVGAGKSLANDVCKWSAAGAKIVLNVYESSEWQAITQPRPLVTRTLLDGVGEEALYLTSGPRTALVVREGDHAYLIQVFGALSQERRMAVEASLARSMLSSP